MPLSVVFNLGICYNLNMNKYSFIVPEKLNNINVRYEIYSAIPAKFCPNLAGYILKKYIEKCMVLFYN